MFTPPVGHPTSAACASRPSGRFAVRASAVAPSAAVRTGPTGSARFGRRRSGRPRGDRCSACSPGVPRPAGDRYRRQRW
jgi:hypothetical protein